MPANLTLPSCRTGFKSRPEHHRAACVETPSRESDTRWMKQFGHAGDRKNELPFRVNSFHPNDLVARSKRTPRCTAGPPASQFCFRFLFIKFRLSGIACSWYNVRTYIPSFLNECSLVRFYHRGQRSGLALGTAERDATSARHEARHSPIRFCVISLRAGPRDDLRRTKARLSHRSRGPNRFNSLNHRSSIGIRDQRPPQQPGKACSAKEKISISYKSLAQLKRTLPSSRA